MSTINAEASHNGAENSFDKSSKNLTTKITTTTTTNSCSGSSSIIKNGHETAKESFSKSETTTSKAANGVEIETPANGNGATVSIETTQPVEELRILGHLKNIEKISEKRRLFLNNTINEVTTSAEIVATAASTGAATSTLNVEAANGNKDDNNHLTSRISSEKQQHQIHTIREEHQEIDNSETIHAHSNGNVKEKPSALSIKYATLPKTTTPGSPLRSPVSPPPKPPMLSRTRSIGASDSRATTPASPTNNAATTLVSSIATAEEAVQLRKQLNGIEDNVEIATTSANAAAIATTLDETKEKCVAAPISPKHYESLVEQLRCPGCASAMKAPILLCKSGHSICEQCTRILLMCPLCKETFTQTRSLTVEALCAKAHFRCSYAAGGHGCTVRMPIALLDWHEKQCVYKPMKCFMGRVWGDCQWYGREIQWKEHLETEHANKVFATNTIDLIWNMGVKQKPLTGYYVFEVHDEMFNFYEIFDRDRVLFTTTCTSSYKERKYNFAYEVTMIHPNNEALAITQKYPVHSEYDRDILMEGTCVSIPMTDLNKFIDDEKLLHYRVSIVTVKSPRRAPLKDELAASTRKSFPLNYQQTQYEGGNVKSVASDLIITRQFNGGSIMPYADADSTSLTGCERSSKAFSESGATTTQNDFEFNSFVQRKWGTPQLHFNRKYLKNSSNGSNGAGRDGNSSNGDSQDELSPLRDGTRSDALDDKMSLCSTNTSYTKKFSNTLRKSFRALKTDLIEMKPFSKKSSPEKNISK